MSVGAASLPPVAFGIFDAGAVAGPSLHRTARFGADREHLAAIAYLLLRGVERAAAAAIEAPDLAVKIALGEHLGLGAHALAVVHACLYDKLAARYLPAASAAVAARLDADADVVALLAAVTDAAAREVDVYLAGAQAITDGPTIAALAGLAPTFAAQRAALAPLGVAQAAPLPLLRAGDLVAYDPATPLPSPPSWPGRAPHLAYADASIVTHASYADLAGDDAKLRRFVHYVYLDVEIAAIEVCAKNLVAYRPMPLAFKVAMARQIWDEARHARVMKAQLEALGGHEGEFTYSAKVWRKCERGADLAERLAIEQVFQEGNALESNLVLSDALVAAGRDAFATALDYVNADEAVHARAGNAWLRWLTGDDPAAYRAVLERAAASMGVALSGNVPLDRAAREVAGFDAAFVEVLAANNAAAGYRKR